MHEPPRHQCLISVSAGVEKQRGGSEITKTLGNFARQSSGDLRKPEAAATEKRDAQDLLRGMFPGQRGRFKITRRPSQLCDAPGS